MSPERSRTIEIVEFIDLNEVDPIYYDHPYYLVPAKGGEKAYRLLVEVMSRTNKAGLAKFVLHEREYLVAVKSTEGALALITLHYREEILPAADLIPPDGTDRRRREKPPETRALKKCWRTLTRNNMPTGAGKRSWIS